MQRFQRFKQLKAPNIPARQIFGLDYADGVDAIDIPPEQRSSMKHLYWNGVFSLFSEGMTASYTNLFLLALNASNTQIGFLNTITQIATAIAPLPGATMADRSGQYKTQIVLPNVVARLGLLLLALVPFVHLGISAVSLAIGLLVARVVLTSFTSASWTAFVGHLIPARIRAKYFSARTFAMNITNMLGALAAGQLITAIGSPLGYSITFVLACVIGLMASWSFARIPAGHYPQRAVPDSDTPAVPVPSFRQMLASSPQFARFVLCACVLAFGVNIGGPFIQVYQVRVLGFTAGNVGLLTSLEAFSALVMGRIFGSFFFERFGEYRVMRVLRFLTALVPFGWIFAPSVGWGILIVLTAGAVWSGHELANFNGLLAVTPEQGRARFIALYTLAISLCAALGPTLGGILSEILGYQPLFAISAALRALAGLLFLLLVKDWQRSRA